MVTLAKALAQFGYYTFDGLLHLSKTLLAIADDCPQDAQTGNYSLFENVFLQLGQYHTG